MKSGPDLQALHSLPLLLLDLNAIVFHLRQGYDLLNVQQDSFAVAVRFDPYTTNDEFAVVQPHPSGRQFFRELGRHQHDPDVLSELILIWLLPPQVLQDHRFRVIVLPEFPQVVAEDLDSRLERHGRDHRGVADGLKLHVAAILGAFQLDHHEVGFLVQSEQVDPPTAVLPVTEFLRNHQRIGRDHLDLLCAKYAEDRRVR